MIILVKRLLKFEAYFNPYIEREKKTQVTDVRLNISTDDFGLFSFHQNGNENILLWFCNLALKNLSLFNMAGLGKLRKFRVYFHSHFMKRKWTKIFRSYAPRTTVYLHFLFSANEGIEICFEFK